MVVHMSKQDKCKLEWLLEKGLRTVLNDNASSYENFLKKANLPNLYNRRLNSLAIMMFEVIKRNVSKVHFWVWPSLVQAVNDGTSSANNEAPFFWDRGNYARCDRISRRNVSNLFKRDGYRRELQFSLVRAQQTGWKKLRMKSSAFFNMVTPKLIHVERIAK